jgi:DNA-binding transcriptional ArsR family regulator
MFNYMVKYSNAEMDRVFHALADPTRREIVEIVSKRERRASELADSFEISFPAVSRHLKVLEKAGLIRREVHGRVHRFRLETDAMKQAYDWMHEYKKFWMTNLNQLDKFLKKRKEKKR